jgi:hypothetical protein
MGSENRTLKSYFYPPVTKGSREVENLKYKKSS